MSAFIQCGATIASLVVGLVAAAVAFGFVWPLLGDPYAIPLVIGAVMFAGFAIGGTCYLFLSEKR